MAHNDNSSSPTESVTKVPYTEERNTTTSVANTWTQNSRVYAVVLTAYLGIILFGYDAGVAGALVSLPKFMSDFNYTTKQKSAKEIANIQSWIVSILQLGAFAGALAAAPLSQKLGRKWALVISTIVFAVGGIVQTVAKHEVGQMYAGRFIAGLGVGAMSMICPVYAAECSPKEVRGRITGMFQICTVVGVAIAYWISYSLSLHYPNTEFQWRFPLGFQLVPCVMMFAMVPFIPESPRWLVFKGHHDKALKNLAWLRKRDATDVAVVAEITEVTVALEEERSHAKGTFKEMFAKGNRIRFFIAFFLFFLQQWSGQNSISYYAPIIFKSIGIKGTSTGLLASGIYGIVKIVATSIFVAVGIEKVGRSKAIGFGAAGMSLFLWIIGAIFATHIPDPNALTPSKASIAMAAMIYLFVIPYCFSVGPVPWVYCSEIFPIRIRHLGMATASSTQWLFNFCLSKITPTLVLDLPKGRIFLMFAAINVVLSAFGFWLPETAGKSLEQMDVVFGSVNADERQRDIEAQMNQNRHGMGQVDSIRNHPEKDEA